MRQTHPLPRARARARALTIHSESEQPNPQQPDGQPQQLKPEKLTLQSVIAAMRRYPSISVFLVLGIAGLIVYQLLSDQVFASASIDLKYQKDEILSMAKTKLKEWGYQAPNTNSVVVFNSEEETQNFLEQSFGQQEANRIMSTVPVWYWKCSFITSDKPTAIIHLNPTGQLKHFDRPLPNDERLPSLDRKAAEAEAESFAKKEAGIDLSHWTLTSSSDTSLQNRIDHDFKWVDPSTDYHGAHQQIAITVSGNKVCEFDHSLRLTDTWRNQFNIGRSYNNLFATVAQSLYYLFYIGAAVVFIRGIVKKNFSYKTALTFGAIYTLGQMAKFANITLSVQYSNVWWTNVGLWLVMSAPSVAAGFGIAFLFAAAQPLYRELCPNRWPLKDWFTWKMLRTPELIQGIIIGIAACFLSLGYQMIYYLLGERVGYWCPLKAASYGTLSELFPFIDALEIGISASFFEEILFRVIGLALLQRLFRGNFWIANFLQAAIWGFAHSNYPQQPPYARGIELTIEGMFDGWMLKRFGLIPNIVAHYLFDATWTVSVLKGAPLPIALTGLIPIAVPTVVLAISLAVSSWKGFIYPPVLTVDEFRKTAEFLKIKATMGRPIGFLYNALSKRAIIILIALAILAAPIPILISAVIGVGPIASGIKPLQIKRPYAIDAATAYFRDLNISIDGCVTSVTMFVPGPDESAVVRTAKYIRTQVGLSKTKELIEKLAYSAWIVKFQKEATPVSYAATFDHSGNLKNCSVETPDNAPGANLTEAEARQVAEKYFALHQSEWLPITLLDAATSKKQNRTDYTFTFAVPSGKAGTAELLANIDVKGDLVSNCFLNYRIPDAWLKSHPDKPPNNAESALSAVFGNYLLIGLSVLLFYFLWREGHVRWKLAIACGIASAILDIARDLNRLPSFYDQYGGTSPLPTYVTTTLLAWASWAVMAAIIGTACAALAFAIIHKYFKPTYLQSALALAFNVQNTDQRSMQRRFWIDAVLIATYVVLADQAFTALAQGILSASLQPPFEDVGYFISSANAYSAAARIVAAAVITASTYLYLATVLPAMVHKFLRGKRWLACIVAVLWAIGYAAQFGFTGDDFVGFLRMLWIFALVFVIAMVGRRNFLASALILLWTALIPPIFALSRYAMPALIFDWCILIGLAVLPILWFVYLQVAPSPTPRLSDLPVEGACPEIPPPRTSAQ